MVTLEQKVDLIMRYILANGAKEKTPLRNEIAAALSESSTPSEPTTDISSPANDALMTDIIDDLLRELGAPCHLTGYDKVVCAIKFVIEDPDRLGKISHRLYPEVANACDSTASRVERAIRHLVEVAWLRHDTEDAFRIFGHTIDINRGKPTNSEFIAACARIVKRRMREKM